MPSELARAAANVRAAIVTAVSDGTLPPYPEGIRFRVRSRRASLMTAVDVEVLGVPVAWAHPRDGGRASRPSREWRDLEAALKEIASRHYKEDGQGRFVSVAVDQETEIGEG
jgi:hypothetical protein